jgi:glycosyltransferase 2 family protein
MRHGCGRARTRIEGRDRLSVWQVIESGVHRLATADPFYVLAAVALYAVSLFVVGARWRGFLRALGGETSVTSASMATLAGIAVNNVTPSSRVGGEACRIALVRMSGDATWRQATTAAIWDRLSEVPPVAVLAVLAALAARRLAGGWRTAAVAAAIAAGIVLVVVAVRWRRRGGAPGGWRTLVALDRVTVRVFARGVGWSFLLWLQDVVRLTVVARAFEVALGPSEAALLSVLTVVGGLVPTLGGLGAVEGGLVAGLIALGIDGPTAAAITATERGISYGLSTVAGLVVVAMRGGRSLWAVARAASGRGGGPAPAP